MTHTCMPIIFVNGLFFFVLSCSCDDRSESSDAGLQPITDAGEDREIETDAADAAEQNGDDEIGREADPVVITGDELGPLIARDPATLVAFRYRESWERIPVQVDERVMTDIADVYGFTALRNHGITPDITVVLCYADPKTFTGPDTNPAIDADDEVVFMYRDTGTKPVDFEEPQGVQKGSGIEVSISEPGEKSDVNYIYLFTNDGSLAPESENEYGRYAFSLKAGDYPTDYGFTSGPNPEDSWFTSEYYERHFPDRWHSDVMNIRTPGSNAVDIFDAHYTTASDLRECTGADSGGMAAMEGAFVTNKTGPIRSIRSYLGARSAAYSQRTHVFYQKREDIIDNVRVHPTGAVLDVFDHTKEAIGMKYYDASNREGLTIDGVGDSFINTKILAYDLSSDNSWTLVTGPQGSLASVNAVDTNIDDLRFELFYQDNASPTKPCFGDGSYYGTHGIKLVNIPCVESTCPSYLTRTHTLYYLVPETTVTDAERLAKNVYTPLRVEVTVKGLNQNPSDAGDSGDITTDGGLPNDYDANIFDYRKCEKIVSIDKNGDGLDDERWISRLERGGTAIVEEWDEDADGEVDARWTSIYEDRDRLVTEQYDEGADGTVDALRITNSDCSARAGFPTAIWICDIKKIETDIDGDGTIDEIWIVEYSDGKVVAESLDENGDGIIDQRWEIEYDASGDSIKASWDRDGDGAFDETITEFETGSDLLVEKLLIQEWDRDGDGLVDETVYSRYDSVERYQGDTKIAEERCVEIEYEEGEGGSGLRRFEWDENGDGVAETTMYRTYEDWRYHELPEGGAIADWRVIRDEWIHGEGETVDEVITTTQVGPITDSYTKTAWDTDADGEDDLVRIGPSSESPSVIVEWDTDGDQIADWRVTRTKSAVRSCNDIGRVEDWFSWMLEKPQDYQPFSGLLEIETDTFEIAERFERIRGIGTVQPDDVDWY